MISAGEIVKYRHPEYYGRHKYLIVGDIFWKGRRAVKGIRLQDLDTVNPGYTDMSPDLLEVCNED